MIYLVLKIHLKVRFKINRDILKYKNYHLKWSKHLTIFLKYDILKVKIVK